MIKLYNIIPLQKTKRQTMQNFQPWEVKSILTDQSVYNKLRQNLATYEKNYKRYHDEREFYHLPSLKKIGSLNINLNDKSKTITTTIQKQKINQSIDLPKKKLSQQKTLSSKQIQRRKTYENKQNQLPPISSRNSKSDYNVNVYKILFDEQNKYKRQRKREIYLEIFGQKREKTQKKIQISEL